MSNEVNRESFTELYGDFGISPEVLDFAAPILAGLKERFDRIDDTAEYNQLRVIRAMQEAHIGGPGPAPDHLRDPCPGPGPDVQSAARRYPAVRGRQAL